MYQIQFFSVKLNCWLLMWRRGETNLEGRIKAFEILAQSYPRTKRRIIDLNTGNIVYT